MIIHKSFGQGSAEWLKFRSVRATASEFGKIFTGGGKISNQREAYMRKCAVSTIYTLPPWSGNEYTERGTMLEPIARSLFRERADIGVIEVASIEHDNGLCAGSPDGLIYDSERLVSGLEIKCYNYDKHVDIFIKNAMPTDCNPQVHGLLWLTGCPSWVFMIYHDEAMPFDYRVMEITPNSYTDNLGNEVMEFCDELTRRTDEFIDDFEKSLSGIAIWEAMPTLSESLACEEVSP